MKYCVSCDFRTCDGETTCPRCGKPLNTVRRCKRCDAGLSSEMGFCPRCGAPVTPPTKFAKFIYEAHRDQKITIIGEDYEDEP